MTDTARQPLSGHAVRDRRTIFDNRMFALVSDDVAMPGDSWARRDYLVHVGAVGVVALDDRERVVLVRQYRHPVGARLWELPAGLIDVPDEGLHEAAARELAEEADLRAGQWQLLLDLHVSPGSSNEVIRLFLARELTEVPDGQRHQREDEEAELEVHRVPLDEAVGMALRGEITNAACLVGLLATATLRAQGWPPASRPLDTPLPRRPLAPVLDGTGTSGG